VKFSFLDQKTGKKRQQHGIDPKIHHSLIILIQIVDYCFWGLEDVEEEERVRARKELCR